MSFLTIFLLCFPEVGVVVLCLGALFGWFLGDILKILLMLTVVAVAPFVVIYIISVIYSKSVVAIRDKFRIEGERFAHLCIATQVASAVSFIVISILYPYMLFFAALSNIIYIIISIIFWRNEYYKGIMVSSAIYVAVVVLFTLFCRWVFSSTVF